MSRSARRSRRVALASLPLFCLGLLGSFGACSLDGLVGGVVDAGSGRGIDATVVTDADVADVGEPESSKPDAGGGDGGAPCAVETDTKLHCHYSAYTRLFAQPTYDGGPIDHLNSPNIPFDCWGTGERHIGNNTTWYRTHGDDPVSGTRPPGWAAGADLSTPNEFDSDPSAFGLAKCL